MADQLTLDTQVFDKFISTLDRIDKGLTNVSTALNALSKLSTGIKFEFSGLDKLTDKSAQILDITKIVKSLGDANFKNVATNAESLGKAVKNIVSALSTLSNLDTNKFAGVKDFFAKDLGNMFIQFGVLSKISGKDTEKSFDSISKLVNSISRVFKDVAAVSGKDTSGFGSELRSFLGTLLEVLKRLPNEQNIKQVSLVFERIGIGISGMLRNLSSINFGSSAKLIAFLTSLTLTMRLIGGVATKGEGGEALNTLSKLFTSIASLLQSLFKGIDLRSIEKTKSFDKIIVSRLKSIIKLVGQFSKINIKDTKGISEVIRSILEIIKFLTVDINEAGSTGNEKSMAGLVGSVKNLIKAFKELNKLKINKNVAESLRGLADILINAGNIAELSKAPAATSVDKNAFGFGKNIASQIALGFVAGNIALSILKTIGNAFLSLNPVSLTAHFVSGLINIFQNTVGKISTLIKNIGNQIRQVGDDVQNVGRSILQNFGIQNVIGSTAVKLATEFDDISNRLEVFGGLTGEATVEAQNLAFEIGKKFPLSANDALNAILDLTKAGLGLEPIKDVLPTAAELSALTDTGNLELVTKTLVGAAVGFTKFNQDVIGGFDNIDVAANAISAAADVSTASVESLSEGLANASAAANNFGLTFEETNAVLAVFEDNNVRGAEAGTQLKSLLTNLKSATARKELKRLNVSLTDAEGNFKNFDTIIDELNKKYENYTEAQRADSIQKLAGSYGQAGLSFLLASNGIDSTLERMKEIEPVSARASKLLDTLKGDTEQLKGSVETLGTKAFLPLIDTLFRPFVNGLRGIVDALIGLDSETLAVISTAITFGAALATLIGSGLILIGTILKVGGSVISLVGTFLNFGNVILGIVGGLAGFITGLATIVLVAAPLIAIITGISIGFRALVKIFDENIGGAADAFTRLKDSIASILEPIGQIASAVLGIFGQVLTGSGGLESVGKGIANVFDNLTLTFNAVGEKVKDVAEVFTGFFAFLNLDSAGDEAEKNIRDNFQKLIEAGDIPIQEGANIEQKVREARLAVNEQFQTLVTALVNNPLLQNLLGGQLSREGIISFFARLQGVVEELKVGFGNVFGSIGTFFSNLSQGKGFAEAFDAAKEQLSVGAKQIATSFFTTLRDVFNVDIGDTLTLIDEGRFGDLVGRLISSIVSTVKNFILQNRNLISDIFTGLFSGIFNLAGLAVDLLNIPVLTDVFNEFERIVGGLFRGVLDTIFNLLEGQDFATAITNAFGPGIQPLIDFATQIGEVIGTVISIFEELFAAFTSESQGGQQTLNFLDIINGVLGGLTAGLEFLNDRVLIPLRNILQRIDFSGLLKFFSNLFSGIVSFISSVFTGDLSGIFSSLADIGQTIGDAFNSVINAIFNIDLGSADNILQGFGLVLESIFGTLGSVASGIIAGIPQFISDVGTFIGGLLGLDGLTVEDLGGIVAGVAAKIGEALSGIPDLLVDLGTTLGAPIITKIGEALKTGDFGPVVDEIFTGISNAVGQVGTTVEDLGETLGSPLITKLGEALKTGDFSGVVTEIFDGITRTITEGGETLEGIGETLGSPLITKLGEALKTGDFNPVVEELFTGIENAITTGGTTLEGIGTAISAPLITKIGTAMRTGDFSSVVSEISTGISTALNNIGLTIEGIGAGLSSPLISALGAAIKTGDFSPVLTEISSGIQNAASNIGATLQGFGTSISSSLITEIGIALQTGDFSTVAQTLANTFTQAVQLVPQLITGIGQLVGSSFLLDLGLALTAGSSVGEFLGIVSGGLADLVETAVEGLGDLLSIPETTLNLPIKAEFSLTNVVANILSFPFEALSAIGESFSAIGDILADVASHNEELGRLLIILGAIALVTIGPNLPMFLTTLSTTVKASLPALKAFAGAIAVFVILKNALENLKEFLETGDIGAFIRDTLLGIGTDILGFFGLELDENKLVESFNQLFTIIQEALQTFKQGIENIVDGIIGKFDGLIVAADRVRDALNLTDDATESLSDQFDRVTGSIDTFSSAMKSALTPNEQVQAAEALLGTIADVSANALNPTIFQRQLRNNRTEILSAIKTALFDEEGGFRDVGDETLRKIGVAIADSGELETILNNIPPIDTGAFLDRLISVTPDQIDKLDFNLITTKLNDLLVSGDIDAQTAFNVAFRIKAELGTDTPAEITALLQQIKTLAEEQGIDLQLPTIVGFDVDTIQADINRKVGEILLEANIPVNLELISDQEAFTSKYIETITDQVTQATGEPISPQTALEIAFNQIVPLLDSDVITIDQANILMTQIQAQYQALMTGEPISVPLDVVAQADLMIQTAASLSTSVETFEIALQDQFERVDAPSFTYEARINTIELLLQDGAITPEMAAALTALTKDQLDQKLIESEGAKVTIPTTVTVETVLNETEQEKVDAAVQGLGEEPVVVTVPVTVVTGDASLSGGPQEAIGFASDEFNFTVDTTVTPEVTVDTTTVAADVETEMQTVVSDTGATIEVPIAPKFEGIETQEDVVNLQANLTTLNTTIDTTETNLDTLALTSTETGLQLTAFGETSVLVSTIIQGSSSVIQGAWTAVSSLFIGTLNQIRSGLDSVTSEIQQLAVALGIAAPTIAESLLVIGSGFSAFTNRAIGDIGRLTAKMDDFSATLQGIITQLSEISDGTAAMPGSGGETVPGREKGGQVRANRLYEVAEGNIPEILRQGNRTFLIPGSNGMVLPVGSLNATSLNVARSNGMFPTQPASNRPISSSPSTISIVEGAINISINAPAGANVAALVPQIRDAVRQELDNRNQNFSARLRTSGRS